MTELTLTVAQTVIAAALAHAREKSLAPMAVAVLDARAALKAFAAEDGTALRRAEIAIGKANGAVSMGVGSRTLAKNAAERPHFIAAVTHAVGGSLIPVAGGVLIRGANNTVIGAVGVSGDTSDNDEACGLAGLTAAGLRADPS
nr:heme-binding protein [uncultured Rhodopila sp.]